MKFPSEKQMMILSNECCENADCEGFDNCAECWEDFQENHAQTNYDRIRAMSVDEMATFLMEFVTEALTNPKCIVVKTWLESEVTE